MRSQNLNISAWAVWCGLGVVAGCAQATVPTVTPPYISVAEGPTVEPAADLGPTPPTIVARAVPQTLVFADEDFRKNVPAPGTPRPVTFDPVVTFNLANGAEVVLVEDHSLPAVSLRLMWAAGAYEGPGQAGHAALCMDLLNEGPASLDKTAWNATLGNLASMIRAEGGVDRLAVSLATLRDQFPTTLALLGELLRSPGLRDADFARLLTARRESLKQLESDAGAIASRVANMWLWGAAHPYGAFESQATLDQASVAACGQFVAESLRPRGARIIIVGDITRADLEAAWRSSAWEFWQGQAKPRPAIVNKAEARRGGTTLLFVDVPGAQQATVLGVGTVAERGLAGLEARTLAGRVLGGGFNSRVNLNLREDKGYTYGARAALNHDRYVTVLSARAPVVGHSALSSLEELARELDDAGRGRRPIDQSELAREVDGDTLALADRFATFNAKLASYAQLVNLGLPLDYWQHYASRLRELSPAKLNRALRSAYARTPLIWVVAGDGNEPQRQREGKADVARGSGDGISLRDFVRSRQLPRGVSRGTWRQVDAYGNLVPVAPATPPAPAAPSL